MICVAYTSFLPQDNFCTVQAAVCFAQLSSAVSNPRLHSKALVLLCHTRWDMKKYIGNE